MQTGIADFLLAFSNVIEKLEGSWAIAAIITGLEGILVSRSGTPLLIGKGKENVYISSDIQAFYGTCSEVAFLDDNSSFLLNNSLINEDVDNLRLQFNIIEGEYDEQNSGIYGHMMLKEIHDQPHSLSNALGGRISSDGLNAMLSGFSLSAQEMKNLDRINLVACGTAYYASEIISSYIRKYTKVRCEAFLASEFPSNSVCSPNTLTVGISQSGETKDTLDALMDAKSKGSHVAALCNVIGSTISRYVGNGAYLYAGPEYAVASTKVFTNMLGVGLLLALTISDIIPEKRIKIVNELRRLPNSLTKQLSTLDSSFYSAVEMIQNSSFPIYIGRGPSSYLAKEGALKMMEVTYIPCLAVPAGELKHGTIALIEEGTPIIAIAPNDSTLTLMEASVRQCKSRGAKIILITDSDGPITKYADVLINTTSTHEDLYHFVNIIPLQLLSYYVGIAKEVNVDRPRNLAKSVTVI